MNHTSSNNKKILIISPFPPQIGGVSISSERLVENLSYDGYDVDYYRIKYKKEKFNNPILLILKFFYIPFYILFHQKYDIIHLHVPSTYRKVYISLTKRLFFKGAKTVFTLHGDVSNLLNSKLALWALSKADKIICVQKGDSQRLPAYLQKISIDIPAFILPKSINDDSIPQNVLHFCIEEDKPLIVFYGAIKLHGQYPDLYGISDIFNLYNHLTSKKIKMKMLLLITINNKNHEQVKFLEAKMDNIKQNDDLLIIQDPHFPMLPILKHTNIYVRPTKTDGDSLAIREALAMGCTVVASDKAKRPSGVLVYSNESELSALVEDNINIPKTSNHIQNSFYNQIVQIYHGL